MVIRKCRMGKRTGKVEEEIEGGSGDGPEEDPLTKPLRLPGRLGVDDLVRSVRSVQSDSFRVSTVLSLRWSLLR